jgi:hypothetical protein
MTRILAWFVLLLPALGYTADAPPQGLRIHDPDPQHLWNRLHETLFVRVAPDGERYGKDRIDLLYWLNTRNLLTEPSHRKALAVLDEFISKGGEKLLRDPLKRAFLQHDLWSLFDWSTGSPHNPGQHARERKALQTRLATVIRRLALTRREIESLPDNYAGAQAQAGADSASLPRGLFQQEGDWVSVSRARGGPIAPVHLADFGGRSVFEVFLRLPEGRAAALSYLEQLRSFQRPWVYPEALPNPNDEPLVLNPALPQFPVGTQWALVRRMCVIDSEGRIQPTSVVASIQLRHYMTISTRSEQQVFEFVASRARNGDLRRVLEGERDFNFVQFRSQGADVFERVKAADFPKVRHDILRSCFQCHGFGPGIQSVQSYFPLFSPRMVHPPELTESAADREAQETVVWKRGQHDFGLLQGLWMR